MPALMRAVISTAAAIFIIAGNAKAQKADPAVYGALPTVSDAVLSPDGKTVALMQSLDGVRSVNFYDLSGDKPPNGIKLGKVKARGIEWASNDHVILLVSASVVYDLQRYEFWRWVSINKNTSKTAYLFSRGDSHDYSGSPGQLAGIMPNRPDTILMARFSKLIKSENEYYYNGYALFEVDLNNGKQKRFASGTDNTHGWIVNTAGTPVLRIDYDSHKEERKFYLPKTNSNRFVLASTIEDPDDDDRSLSIWAPADTSSRFYATTREGDRRALYIFDVKSGEIVETVLAPPNHDLGTVIYDYRTAEAIGARYTDDMRQTHFFNDDLKKIQASLEAALPGAAPVITSWSSDRTKFLILVNYTDHPDQYYLFDKSARRLSMLAPTYKTLDGKSIAKREKFDYQSSDGLNIPGYLTVPAGSSKSSMPMIVLPHGGPWHRDDQSFDWWAFFYAARGYLVYQPNFRGSYGFGAAFKHAGDEEWGGKMQDDITEGVEKLIHDGIANPSRICIVGGSYGGYAALAGATLTPELYACAVSVAGVSNLPGMLGSESRYSEGVGDYWERRIGSRLKDKEKLLAVSPAFQAENAKAPILLIHGRDDTVVPIGQSRLMNKKLKDAGKEVEYIILEGEDHWLSTAATRTEMLSASIEFIDRHIGQ